MSKELRKALDLEPEQENVNKNIVHIEDDYEFARKNLYDIIGKGQEILEDMIDVARKSQHPRAYEVLNSILKNTADMNKDLLELQKKKQEMIGIQPPSTVNNNLFVGTTSDLNKFLEDMQTKDSDNG